MIKRIAVLVCLCLLLSGCVSAQRALPAPTDRFFVNDYADVLSAEDEQTVYEAGVRLMQETEAQLVLVTVDSLDGYSLEEYALELARTWELGDAEMDNGLLLLFTTDGPHTRAEVGYGLEGALPDSKVGRILDEHLVPYYTDQAAWSAALTDTYRTYVNEVYAEYGLTESQYPVELYGEDEEGGWLEIIAIFAALLLFGLLRARGLRAHPGLFIGGFHHHGGGFGGGSFGGGGGGFRGGGGGFGGGGASR